MTDTPRPTQLADISQKVCEYRKGSLLVIFEDQHVYFSGSLSEPYKTNDDSREKIQVGHQWERSSGERCLFLFAVERDDQGRDVFQQVAAKLSD